MSNPKSALTEYIGKLREFYRDGFTDVIIVAARYDDNGMDLQTYFPTLTSDPQELVWHLRKLIDKLQPPMPDDTDFETDNDESNSGHA